MSKLGNAAKGAAAGWSVGSVPGAIVGGIAGFFGGPDKPDLPEIYWSDESLRKLEEDFPELYEQMMKGRVMSAELASRADKMYNQGIDPRKAQMIKDEQAALAGSQAMSGELGSLIGSARQSDQTARLMNAAIDSDRQAALQALMQAQQAQQGQFGQEMGYQAMLRQAQEANIARAMQRDAAVNARNMMGYQQGMQDYNQWGADLGSLAGMGLGASMNPYTAGAMKDMRSGVTQGLGNAWDWAGRQFSSSSSTPPPQVSFDDPYYYQGQKMNKYGSFV